MALLLGIPWGPRDPEHSTLVKFSTDLLSFLGDTGGACGSKHVVLASCLNHFVFCSWAPQHPTFIRFFVLLLGAFWGPREVVNLQTWAWGLTSSVSGVQRRWCVMKCSVQGGRVVQKGYGVQKSVEYKEGSAQGAGDVEKSITFARWVTYDPFL